MNWKMRLEGNWGRLVMMYKLSDICDYVKEKTDVVGLDENTYISTENMIQNKGGISPASSLPTVTQIQAFAKGDVLVSNIRPYFKKIWFAEFDGGCSNDVLVFRTKEGVSKRFLYYVLADDAFFTYSMATSKGTKMPRGDKKAIMEYEVPSFSFDEQVKVAGILELLDKKTQLNREINDNLEQQLLSYYNELFVTNAKENWKEGTIADLGKVVGGSTPSKKKDEYYTDQGIAWITPKDLSNNHSKFITHGEIDITELGLANSSAVRMPAGTVLFSSRAPIGYTAIADDEVTTNQGFKSVVPFENIGTAYVYCFLKANLSVIENMASGSTFKEISGSTMKTVPAVIPDEDTLSIFRDYADAIFDQQRNNESENRVLTSIKDSLLPRLMSGDLDVSSFNI